MITRTIGVVEEVKSVDFESFIRLARRKADDAERLVAKFDIAVNNLFGDLRHRIDAYNLPDTIFRIFYDSDKKVAFVELAGSRLTMALKFDIVEVYFNGKIIDTLRFDINTDNIICVNGEKFAFTHFENWLDNFED